LAGNVWKIRVTSAVCRTDPNGRRVPVVPGDYRVVGLDAQGYEFSLSGTATFQLSLADINRYIEHRAMKPLVPFP
jgi:hypothetical protein